MMNYLKELSSNELTLLSDINPKCRIPFSSRTLVVAETQGLELWFAASWGWVVVVVAVHY